jgi:hypothetical protein
MVVLKAVKVLNGSRVEVSALAVDPARSRLALLTLAHRVVVISIESILASLDHYF